MYFGFSPRGLWIGDQDFVRRGLGFGETDTGNYHVFGCGSLVRYNENTIVALCDGQSRRFNEYSGHVSVEVSDETTPDVSFILYGDGDGRVAFLSGSLPVYRQYGEENTSSHHKRFGRLTHNDTVIVVSVVVVVVVFIVFVVMKRSWWRRRWSVRHSKKIKNRA